ncbi:MAG: hypothetical protein WAM97_10395 [Acidimicrobiales bacterium]
MHKLSDDEQICPECGSILLSTADRRVSDPDTERELESVSVSAPFRNATSSTVTSADIADAVRELLASSEVAEPQQVRHETHIQSEEAMRQALGDLGEREKRSAARTGGSTQPGRNGSKTGDTKPFWKRNPKLTAVVGGIALVVVILVLIMAFGGSPNSNDKGYNANGTTTNVTLPGTVTQSIFEFSGEGTGVTAPFTTTSTFALSYTVSCPQPLSAPATFKLLSDNATVAEASSPIGSTKETGSQTSFGKAGTFTVSVDAPPTCTWLVRGDT